MKKFTLLLLLLAVIISISLTITQAANTVGGNYKNVTVRTTLNITNARPELLSVIVYQETNLSVMNITLNAGGTRTVTCNATVRDWNGHGDVTAVNATFWDSDVSSSGAADDNNSHYTDPSCDKVADDGLYTGYYICQVNTYYYSNYGTWNCSVTAVDNRNKTANMTNTTYIYTLYALNVTDGIDYGNMQVDDISPVSINANITNFGNMNINITVEGYGVNRYDGLAMNCSVNGNISIGNERFSLNETEDWSTMIALNGTSQLIPNLTISKQTVAGTQMINGTYWKIYVPPNPAGNCSGFIMFSAEAP